MKWLLKKGDALLEKLPIVGPIWARLSSVREELAEIAMILGGVATFFNGAACFFNELAALTNTTELLSLMKHVFHGQDPCIAMMGAGVFAIGSGFALLKNPSASAEATMKIRAQTKAAEAAARATNDPK